MSHVDDIYHDVMLDIETLGLENDAVVLSIGAVKFRLDTRDSQRTLDDPSRCFYSILDTDDQRSRGRTISDSTVEWWATQSRKARSVFFSEEKEQSKDVVERLGEFLSKVRRVWGNGNTFDNAIVKDLFKTYDVEYPVHYTGDLDLRTLTYIWNLLKKAAKRTVRPKVKFKGTAHNALDDAKSQVLEAQNMYSELKPGDLYKWQ